MAFEPSYNLLDKDTHNTLVEALKSGGIGYTEADGTVHKISGDYVEGGGGGGSDLPEVSAADNGDVLTVVEGEWAKATPSGGGGFDAIIKGEQVDDAWVYTLLSGTYSAVKSKLATGIPYVLIGTWAEETQEGVTIEGYDTVELASISLFTAGEVEWLLIQASGTLYWLPDGTITDEPPVY